MRSTAWNDEENKVLPEMALDFMPEEKLRDLQLQRMRATVKLAYEKVPLFRERMDEKGLKPEDIKTLKDVAKLPFTMKKDLRDTYPYGLFAVDLSEVVRLHASSGTTGKPIVVGYTKEDMDVWAQVVKRGLLACGFRSTDIVQNFYGYGLFTGGLGIHGGFDFGVTAVGGTPSYFVRIIDVAEKMGVNIRDLKVKRGIFGAEPWSDGMRDYIEEKTGIKAYDIYGLSEIVGPGVGCECECRDGIYIFEDYFYPEIVDPETLEPLPDGEEG